MRRVLPLLLAVTLLAACGGGDPAASTTTRAIEPRPVTTSPVDPGDGTATPTTVDELRGFVPAPLAWSGCGEGIECATLAVPVDWADVTGPSIELALRRAPATGDGSGYLGSLAFNLGGPGATTNPSLRPGLFGPTLSEHFDILAWDVRGVGESSPLACGDNVEPFVRLDSSPDDAAEQQALEAAAAAVAQECGAEDGALLPHVGTDDVARDLEAIRRASGVPLSFLGFSYGTLIGLRYLDLFPTSPARVVLDGVVDPEHSLADLLRNQVVGFEQASSALLDRCPDGGVFDGIECPEGGAAAAYDRVAASVEQAPMRAGADVLGPGDLATALASATYSPSRWAQLFTGLRFADGRGDGTQLLDLARTYRGFGSYPLYYAVSCIDSAQLGLDQWPAFADELAAISPRLGAAMANEMLPCATWPTPPRPVTGPVDAAGAHPVLVIGTTGDAATPLAQAERVAANLTDGHLLVFEGDVHTAFTTSQCVQLAVIEFLVAGVLPAEGGRC